LFACTTTIIGVKGQLTTCAAARFGKEGNDLVDVLIAADKVMDF
jgi:hypothetical protein